MKIPASFLFEKKIPPAIAKNNRRENNHHY